MTFLGSRWTVKFFGDLTLFGIFGLSLWHAKTPKWSRLTADTFGLYLQWLDHIVCNWSSSGVIMKLSVESIFFHRIKQPGHAVQGEDRTPIQYIMGLSGKTTRQESAIYLKTSGSFQL